MLAVPTSAGDNDAWHHYSWDALTDGTETLCFSPQKEDGRTNLVWKAWRKATATAATAATVARLWIFM